MTDPSITTPLAPVVVEVTVRVPLEAAFRAFTHDFDRWWPTSSHHIGATDPAAVVLEPRTGGRWFERGTDGVECDWGRVLAWDPPHHLRLVWNLDGTWAYRPGDENASLVDVRFTAVEPAVTQVTVEHSGFEAHGATAAALREGVAAQGGWASLVGLWAAYAESAAE